jgi:hypothetical protein
MMSSYAAPLELRKTCRSQNTLWCVCLTHAPAYGCVIVLLGFGFVQFDLETVNLFVMFRFKFFIFVSILGCYGNLNF